MQVTAAVIVMMMIALDSRARMEKRGGDLEGV